MKLNYTTQEEVSKEIEINEGDLIDTRNQKTRVLAIVGSAIIVEHAINAAWSNKVYSATQLMQYNPIITPKTETPPL